MSYYYSEVEWNSDYDSTWEDEKLEPPKKKKTKSQYQRNYVNRAARDMQNYRHGYGQTDNYQVHQDYMPNLAFYQNKIAFEPYGVTIEEFHRDWREDYEELEENHGFIQWLFPLRERGVNPRALPLTLAELKVMKADNDIRRLLLESYKLMLGFYGIQLLNEETGEVSRAENYKERFRNLNNHSHNNLRITRILKCLGEMGFEHLQAPLVRFFLEETLCNNNLPSVTKSALDYFMFTVKDKQERRELVQFAWANYKSQEPFIWGPVQKLRNLENERKKLGNKVTAEKQDEENPSLKQDEAAGGGDAPYVAWEPNLDVLPKHELGESLGEAGSDDGGPGVASGRPHHEVLQKNQTGEALEEAGVDNGGPEVDELGALDNVHPREALEHEDVISNSRKENPTTDRKSTGNEQKITGDKSTGDEQKITGDKSTGNEQKITEDNSTGNEQKITEDNSTGNELTITKNETTGNEHKITEDKSTGNEQKITEDKSTGNEQKITEDKSTGNEQKITEAKSTGNEQKITEAKSTGNEQKVTEAKSTGNEQKRTEAKSTGNEQKITEDKSTGNEQKVTEDKSTRLEQKITKDKSSGHGQQKTEVNGLGDKQTRVYNSSGNKQTTENTSFINHKHTIADAENMKPITEGPSIKNGNMTTGVTSHKNAKLLTQSEQPESPKKAEEQRLLSGPRDKEEPPSVCCCFICWFTHYT